MKSRLILAVLLTTLAANLSLAQRQEIHCRHFLHGYLFGASATNDVIIRDLYALSSNDETKFAAADAARSAGQFGYRA
jgi:hypothetical protein